MNLTYLIIAALTVTTTIFGIGWRNAVTSPDVYASDMQFCTAKLEQEQKRVEILTGDLQRGDQIVNDFKNWASDAYDATADVLEAAIEQCPNGILPPGTVEKVNKSKTDYNDIITRGDESFKKRMELHQQYGL